MNSKTLWLISGLCWFQLGFGIVAAAQQSVMDLSATEEMLKASARFPRLPRQMDEDLSFRPRSRWTRSWFNWATQSVRKTSLGTARLSSYNHFGFEYHRNREETVSLRAIFFLSGAGQAQLGDREYKSEFEAGDMYLQYSRYNLALLPGDIGMLGQFRVYLPTSDYSRQTTEITELRAKLIFSKSLGRGLDLNYILEPKYLVHRQRGSPSEFQTYVKANKRSEIHHYFELDERMSSWWGFSQSLGLKHQWYYDVPSARIPAQEEGYLEAEIGAFFDLDEVNFSLGLNNSIDIRRNPHPVFGRGPDRPFRFFRADETNYSLRTYVRF